MARNMIKIKQMLLGCFFAVSLVAACSGFRTNQKALSVQAFPTATNHFLFLSDSTAGTPLPDLEAPIPGVPTVASIFRKHPTTTPSLGKTANPTPETTPSQMLSTQYSTLTVYRDTLNPNWEVQSDTGMDFDLGNTTLIHQGNSAISFTPQVDYARLFFTVSGNSQGVYLRDQVAELSFWIYSGESELALDQLAVTIVGSNSQPFWRADDHSVTVDDDLPVFSETRLYYLGFNYTIPARTWVPVELDLDKTLIYDPEYRYVTGFYLKTEAGLSHTLSIDDISLLMYDSFPDASGVETTPSPNASLTPAEQKTVTVQIDTQQDVHPISPLIYGVSGAPAEVLQALRPGLNSWGGDSSTRYNWNIGHASSAGREDTYRNENYGGTSGSASDEFVSRSLEAGAAVRLSIPTLGWVAKNADPNT